MQGWARRKITYSIATTKASNGSKKNRGISDKKVDNSLFHIPESDGHNILIKNDGTEVVISDSECDNYTLTNAVPVTSMDTIYYYKE